MNVAVVGAGPAGAALAWHLARDGARVSVFDASHPREKPCGGGLTPKALDLLPPAPADDPLPARFVTRCRFESGEGELVDVALTRPVAVVSRRLFDAWLLRRATQAGARHLAERVNALEAEAGAVRVRTASGSAEFDVVVGADGAGSLVRRTFASPTPRERLTIAAGWLAPGEAPMTVRFAPGLDGYVWLFPRPDHVGVGICAPLASLTTAALLARLERDVRRDYPALARDPETRWYAHTIPSPSSDPRSLLEIAGPRWALVGDAAALADPVTGEGIHSALNSARVLAATLREEGSPVGYPSRALHELGPELLRAASLRRRFYAPGFPRRMVRFSAWSPAVRQVLGDLVLGEQDYTHLKSRLLRALPRFLWDLGRSSLLGHA